MTPHVRTTVVKRLGQQIGLDRVGVATLAPPAHADYYREWLHRGHAGTMQFLHRNSHLRENPREILNGALTAICVAVSYRRPKDEPATPGVDSRARTGSEADSPPVSDANMPYGRVAAYARGADYHVLLRDRLNRLVNGLRDELQEEFDARVFVDTGPILERELAAAAGIGWIGKNTILMNEKLGTYLLLGEVLTTLDLEPDAPVSDHCGACTRCLDACPTQAFPAPYQLNASKCIAYWTIEHRGEIPEAVRPAIGDWVFGCDVCQQVCPFNNHAAAGATPELLESRIPARVPLPVIFNLTSGDYRRLTRGTSATRASRKMWMRNAKLAIANQMPKDGIE